MKRLLCLSALVGLSAVPVACGDDDADASPSSLTVTVDGDTLQTSGEARAGAVDVTVSGIDPGVEVDFTRVEPGTSTDALLDAISIVLEGGPFADFILGNAGTVAGTSTILLDAGSYVVWADLTGEDGGEPQFVSTTLEVDSGGGASLPDTDGTFTAEDYGFDVDASAGDTFTILNNGAEQFHHAVLLNFGDIAPADVEANISALFEAGEDDPPPEPFAGLDFSTFEAGSSPVYGPGSGGTFEAQLESGNTYAVVCFISDRAGGPPHAIQHDMYEVFTIG